ncbi:L,D-transpeptidase family protein [Algicella marina]|uniref:L,D-transpeptidase family protein n=1 Tax=Algicella marina TaxID=2683284 RepID=A0A6P1T0W3_9RHOB|nr:L,D-transpeptidase family protein [Algicella marina]QHQ36378.1 L,D-transpeptidase family protein [Algicella marina]
MTPADLVVGRWGARFMGRSLPCAIGKGGVVSAKREGDGGSPRGCHRVVGGMYRADRLTRAEMPGWLRPIGPQDCWSDDVRDDAYNHLVRWPRGFSCERLARADPLYDLVLMTDYNWPEAKKGAGSAIFLHVWRKARHPTEGCVAFRLADLLWIVRRWQSDSRVIIR